MAPHLLNNAIPMIKEHLTTEPIQGRQWYVVYSKPRREEFAQSNLQRKGLEVFFPKLAVPYVRPKQNHIVPLFPNYLFVRLQLPTEYNYALWSPGVKSIVSFNDTPAPIDEAVIKFLQSQADLGGVIKGRPQLTVGQQIRIHGGPLDGLIGIIHDPPDARGRVGVLMQLLNRQVKVAVPMQFVESSWTIQGNK
jgi:transcription elongation factor/antiterminator RfaH